MAALFVAGCVLAFNRSGPGSIGTAVRVSIILLAAITAWTFIGRAPVRDREADGRAIEARAAELTSRAVATGSALACLDGIAGETVEAACERAIFASPESVAAAISYVSARLMLLADVQEYVRFQRKGSRAINVSETALRRSLDADHFGFVAHVLAVRDGCTSPDCKALSMLGEATRVRANLSSHELDRYLDHYAEVWAKEPVVAPTAEAVPSQPSKPKVSVNIDFPSAASIPPVSIMNAEPTGPVLPGVAAAAAANPNPPPTPAKSARSFRKRGAPAPSQQSAVAAPTPAPAVAAEIIAPPAVAPITPTPTPPVPAVAANSGAGATTGAPVVPPVQLVPFPPTPEASAGLATRQQ
jgi:hypothetical protein